MKGKKTSVSFCNLCLLSLSLQMLCCGWYLQYIKYPNFASHVRPGVRFSHDFLRSLTTEPPNVGDNPNATSFVALTHITSGTPHGLNCLLSWGWIQAKQQKST